MALGDLKIVQFLKRKKKEYDFFEEFKGIDETSVIDLSELQQGSADWDWDSLVNERHLFRMGDADGRAKYIRNLVEEVKNASDELDKLGFEYNKVTATLKDMDEIEALPEPDLESLKTLAENVVNIEGKQRDYQTKKGLMSETNFQAMERFADNMPKAYEDIKEQEEYKQVIIDDLKKLDNERHAFTFRGGELSISLKNMRGIVSICIFATILCVVMLLILQFGFGMNTKIGYTLLILAMAVTLTLVYIKYMDCSSELSKVNKSINRIILLQNTVKIRYVNNKNLLDYLYTKYDTTSSKELLKVWNLYQEEKNIRILNEENERQYSICQKEYRDRLKRYHLSDVSTWVHNPLAIMDKREMVEIRHSYIIQRQKLRAQMDYNKRIAKDGEKELKDMIKEYPEYKDEVLEMMDRYS